MSENGGAPSRIPKHTQWVSPRMREKKGADRLFEEIMASSFPNLIKSIYPHIQKAQHSPNKINSKGSSIRLATDYKLQRLEGSGMTHSNH